MQESIHTHIKKLTREMKFSTKKQTLTCRLVCRHVAVQVQQLEWKELAGHPQYCSQMSLHRCIIKKTVMDPWPAPYQNSNDYQCFTYDQKRSGRNFLHASVNFTVSILCYTNGPYKGGYLHTNTRCCFHCPAILQPLFSGESVSSMKRLHTC